MKYCILMGSPRKNGNTFELLKPFIEELELQQVHYDLIWLYDKHIEPCVACRHCQKDWTIFGCRLHMKCFMWNIFADANNNPTGYY